MPEPTDAERADYLASHAEVGPNLNGAPSWAARFGAASMSDVELSRVQPPAPLISGWLDRGSLAWLHGKPGSGKSFLAVDMAACVATGRAWHGAAVTQGPVVYIAAEALAYMPGRVATWKMIHSIRNTGITWLPMAPSFPDDAQITGLIEWCRTIGPILIVIDTQSRVTPGWADTDARDMGLLIERLDRIRAALGCALLLLHHEPRVAVNLRGSTVLEGAADTIIGVVKEGALMTLSAGKDRGGAGDQTLDVVLVPAGDTAYVSHTLTDVDLQLGPSDTRTLTELADCESEGGATVSRLHKGTELSEATLYRVLTTLRNRGLVYKTPGRPVRYRLTVHADPPLPYEA